jgi:phosphatidylserine/phosphatidylglycerophosphate/cardiolipin synthase-like enzyme
MNDAVIYSRCDVFEVRVTVGAGASLSPVERHVLQAVAAGVDTVSSLCQVLGVSSRMMVDLLGDLWRAGYVTLDLQYEMVSLTQQVRELIAEDALASLPGAETSDETKSIMLDTLTGMLTPVGGPHKPLNGRLAVPGNDAEASLATVDEAGLINAVAWALREEAEHDSTERRTRRVMRAYLSPAALRTPVTERHYRALGVKVALDTDDRLVIRLTDEAVPGRYRDAAQSRLTRLVEDQPKSSFVQALRAAAGGRPQEPVPLTEALAGLAAGAAALSAAPPGTRKREHDQMADQGRRITGRLQGLIERESGVRLLVGQPDHEAAIRRLISEARQQVVLACPWVSYEGFVPYVPLLEEVARRGVQIVLLWGIGRMDVPDQAIRNALSGLERQGTVRRVLISPHVSSLSHAKLVVSDDRQAVVTSLNFLAPSGPGTRETGVLITALAGRHNPALMELLTWARDTMPDYSIAQSVIANGDSFPLPPGAVDAAPAAAGADVAARTAPSLTAPSLTTAASADEPGGPAAAAWALAWQCYADTLAADVLRQPPSVRLIRDGEHRDLLWTALRTARRYLLISSDGLAEDVVDRAFTDYIEQCLDRGVDVTLVYRRARRDPGELAVRSLRNLAGPADGRPGRLTLIKDNNHAKVLVTDDESVVTSFNFLSFDGYYGAVGRRRQRSEVGIRIYGRGVARQLLALFGVALKADDAAQPTTAEVPASGGQMRAFATAQQLLDRLADPEPVSGDELAALAGRGDEAFAVLDALRKCGADATRLEAVVAAVLGRDDDPTRNQQAAATQPWWEWLARRRFEEGDFQVAAALRTAVPGSHAPPRPVLLNVAACRGTPRLAGALADAVLGDDLTQDEWRAVLTVAAHALLATGADELAEVLDMAVPAAGDPWAGLGATARGWWDATMRPLPADQLQLGAQLREHAAGDAGEWAALGAALRAFEVYSPPFKSGAVTQRLLLRAGGPLNLLKLAADQQDRAAVRAWLTDPQLKDIGAWVDAATRESGRAELIRGHLRPPFIDRITAIIVGARAIARRDDLADAAPAPFDEAAGLARDVAGKLRAELPALRAAAAAVQSPEQAVVRVALDDLDALTGGVRA